MWAIGGPGSNPVATAVEGVESGYLRLVALRSPEESGRRDVSISQREFPREREPEGRARERCDGHLGGQHKARRRRRRESARNDDQLRRSRGIALDGLAEVASAWRPEALPSDLPLLQILLRQQESAPKGEDGRRATVRARDEPKSGLRARAPGDESATDNRAGR